MKASFSIINCVYAIFLSGGILVPFVTYTEAAKQQEGLTSGDNNNISSFDSEAVEAKVVGQQYQEEGKDLHKSMTNVVDDGVSIGYKDVERITKKSTFFKDVVKDLLLEVPGLILDYADSDNNDSPPSDNNQKCYSDLNYLSNKLLPQIDWDIITESCVFDQTFDITQKASIKCNFESSPYFLNSFKSQCEDSNLQMILTQVSTFPGEENVYVYSTTDILYELYYMEELNVPICLPRSCTYGQAVTILDKVEDHYEKTYNFRSVSYFINDYPSPSLTNNAHILSSSTIIAILSGMVSALILMF